MRIVSAEEALANPDVRKLMGTDHHGVFNVPGSDLAVMLHKVHCIEKKKCNFEFSDRRRRESTFAERAKCVPYVE